MIKVQFSSLILVFLFTVSACKKEDLPVADGSRIKMISVKTNDSTSSKSFKYDNQNRLTAILGSNGNGYQHNLFIEYNAQERPSKMTSADNGGIINGPFTEHTYSFVYDANGRIVKKIANPPVSYVNLTRNSYAYDTKGRLIADTIHSYWANEVFRYITYVYNNNDNIIERKIFDRSGTLQIEQTMQASYDSKTNPYYNIGAIIYIITGDDFTLNRNNRKTVNYQTGTKVTYDYKYYSNGLPRSYSKRDNQDPIETNLNFSYE